MPIGRLGQDFIVNTTTDGEQIDSAVMALADGRFVATWQSGDAEEGSGSSIRGRIFNADGSPDLTANAGNDFIWGDVDADSGGDFSILLNGLHTLTAADFVL